MKNLWLLAPAFLFLAACASQNSNQEINGNTNPSIVGGEKIQSTSRIGRSTVGLYGKKIGYYCTGTLISDNLVLTAAHCVHKEETELRVVFAAEIKKATPDQVRKVIDAVVHENYKEDAQSDDMADIAVIRFEGVAPGQFTPAPMLFTPNHLHNETQTIVAGYGLSWTIVMGAGAGTLRTTTLAIEDVNYSKTEVMLGQSLRRGICSGDSGGPAYLEINGQLHVWGVASRGDSLPGLLTPKCMLFSVFTRVDAYQGFIQDAMAQLR